VLALIKERWGNPEYLDAQGDNNGKEKENERE
jgi:hypothetical protein